MAGFMQHLSKWPIQPPPHPHRISDLGKSAIFKTRYKLASKVMPDFKGLDAKIQAIDNTRNVQMDNQ
jgi:hypothetical protein